MSGLLIANHKNPAIVPFFGMGKKKKMKGKGVADNLGKALNYLKDTKLISTTMGLLPNEKAQAIANIAKQIGLGKKKRKAKKQQSGGGLFGDLGSGIGNAFGGIGSGLGAAGYGIGKGLFGGKKKGKKMINM